MNKKTVLCCSKHKLYVVVSLEPACSGGKFSKQTLDKYVEDLGYSEIAGSSGSNCKRVINNDDILTFWKLINVIKIKITAYFYLKQFAHTFLLFTVDVNKYVAKGNVFGWLAC